MDLEKNIIDNVLECFVKLGATNTAINFYYPLPSLLRLLNCDKEHLDTAIATFKKEEMNRLGDVNIEELPNEKGRYEVVVPVCGVEWVSKNYTPTAFLRAFIAEIQKPGSTLESMACLFQTFSKDFKIDKLQEDRWALSFQDKSVDPYVYLIEQNVFGLEYHRFTQREYQDVI
ncbi:MAG: DUF3877 family protein [Acetatifactor sp.]|nr:DUF3877 family protein [Acetatifactor sp.]